MVDKATQTPTWPDEQQQLDSQEDDHIETEQTSFQFMALPLELRREVYRHYINNLPSLMYTSPQICREVTSITDRVLIFQMYNGLCPSYNHKKESAELAAAKLLSLHDKYQGQNIRFEIELQCPTTYVWPYGPWKPLIHAIGAEKMAKVEVYMTRGPLCTECRLFPKPRAVELVREMVEQVERLRDGKLLRCEVQTRCDCRGRRLG